MSINTQELFDAVAVKYGASDSNETFTQWFFLSLTRISNDLASSRVGISIDMPNNLGDDIDADAYYFGVIIDGLHKYIQESGMWGNDKSEDLDRRYNTAIKGSHTHHMGTRTVYTRTSGE